MKGIYVIHLPEMELDIYKIGCSKDINSRIESFNNDTLRLYPVKIVYTKEFENYKQAEREVHKQLLRFRINPKREFFKCDLYEILKVINDVYTKLNSKLYNLSNQDKELEYYYNYSAFKSLDLIIRSKYIPSIEELYNCISYFIKTYKVVNYKILTLPEGPEKEIYKELFQDMNMILRSDKITEYVERIRNELN